MGKMKISNKKRKSSKGSSILLTVIVVAIMAGALIACIASVIGSTGLVPRLTTAMKSENFKVNQNMMNYFFQTTYSDFTSDTMYTTLKSNCSLNQGDNAGLPLEEQVIGKGTYDEILAPGFKDKTWHEFFVSKTQSSVTTVLSYCEESIAQKVELDDTDEANIETGLTDMYTSIRYALYMNNGYNTQYLMLNEKECLAYYFGSGVTEGDVKDAMELATLASKTEQKIRGDLSDAIGKDAINKEYNDNAKKYEIVDFLNYSFEVKYDEVSKDVLSEIGDDAKEADHKDKILEAYAAEIKKAQDRASTLNNIKEKEKFIRTALTFFIEDNYEEAYESVVKSSKLEDAKKPSADDEKKIKDAMIAQMFVELFAEDRKATAVDDVEEKDDKYYAYNVEVTKEYGQFLNALKSDIYGDLIYEEESIVNEKSKYNEPAADTEENENSKWIFDAERKVGDTTVIDEGDGADGKAVTASTKSFSADVYLMLKPRYLDETTVRNGAYMIFTSADSAKKAIDHLKEHGNVDLATFLEVAAEEGAGSYLELTDYAPGQMSSDDFDKWMFDSARVKGDYTAEAIQISSSYVLAYFESEGTLEAWEAGIKNALLSDDVTAENTRILEAYKSGIVVKEKVLNKIGK